MVRSPVVEKRVFIDLQPLQGVVAEVDALVEFFVKVSEDEVLFEGYKKDPAGVMKRHGLGDESIHAVTHSDLKKVHLA